MHDASEDSLSARALPIVEYLLELPPDQRPAALLARCRDDRELRHEVEACISLEPRAASFLETPLWDLVGGLSSDGRAGERLGCYEVEALISEGAMGTVYRAKRTDGAFCQTVAVKILKRGMDTRAFLRAFRRERQILATLDHPNIARILDGGATRDGLPYLVMEYVDGIRLDTYCREYDPSLEERLEIFAILCHAVSAAHANLIIHCDLKPANVLMTRQGELKLVDFGIAKLLHSEGDTTARPSLPRLGTWRYASPEQTDSSQLTTATDVYALGVILSDLLTPVESHDGVTADRGPKALMPAKIRGRVAGSMAKDLSLVAKKAKALDPERRYATAGELGREIRRVLEHQPIEARADSMPYVLSRLARRHRPAALLAALLAVSLILGLWGLTLQLRATKTQRDRAVALQDALLEFLEVMDPSRGESEGEALRTALEALKEPTLQLLADDQALAFDRMGRMLYRHGYLTAAQELLSDSLRLRLTAREARPDLVANAHNNLSLVEKDLGNLDRALEHLREAISLQKERRSVSEEAWFDKLNNYALLLQATGDYEEAEKVFGQVVDGQVRLHGRRSVEAATALNNLGQYLLQRGRFEDAEPLISEAVRLRRDLLGENHVRTLAARSNQAILLDAMGETPKAIQIMLEILSSHLETYGARHRRTALSQATLGYLLNGRGQAVDLEQARALLVQASETFLKLYGLEHPATLVSRANLAECLLSSGETSEALAIAQEAVDHARGVWPQGHWRIASVESTLAAALGDSNKARALLEQAVPRLIHATGYSSRYSRLARQRLEQLGPAG